MQIVMQLYHYYVKQCTANVSDWIKHGCKQDSDARLIGFSSMLIAIPCYKSTHKLSGIVVLITEVSEMEL